MKDSKAFNLDPELRDFWEEGLSKAQLRKCLDALQSASSYAAPVALKNRILNAELSSHSPERHFNVLGWSMAALASFIFIFGVVKSVSKVETAKELSGVEILNDEVVYRMVEEDLDDAFIGDYLDNDLDVLEKVL